MCKSKKGLLHLHGENIKLKQLNLAILSEFVDNEGSGIIQAFHIIFILRF
jgi:hypothetical protein